MKIAIVGRQERCIAWEKHLRKLKAIEEVIITNSLAASDQVNAVLLIDDTPSRLDQLLNSVRFGYHTYLISRLSDDTETLEKVYHSAEESGVKVQFSHWPSMAESTNLVKKLIEKPDLIQIKKENNLLPSSNPDSSDSEHDWIDEVALIIKWMGGNIHHMEVKPVSLGTLLLGLAITFRFENSSVATLQYLSGTERDYHQRIISSTKLIADCDITTQKTRILSLTDFGKISVKIDEFDPSDTAKWSVVQFIKSIQTSQKTVFSAYDALLTSRAVNRIYSELK